jgi:hypothetical protein
MQRMPEPDAVQRVAYLARPDEPGHALADGYGAVQAGVLLEAGNQLHAAPGLPRSARLNIRQAKQEPGSQ